ncbi:MAG: SipW-dependent-type signal peptide-containing protein [Aristaeellaceae bacterium]
MSEYKRNPRGARRARKSLSRKAVVILSLMMVLVLAAVGGTLAWLTDSTEEVKNTFTTSDINITLDESDNLNLQMIPGHTITKDPVVTVTKNSEDCYLFVKIIKSDNFDDFMSFDVADGWTELGDGVYYREVASSTTDDQSFDVIKNNTVTVSGDVTKAQMEALTDDTKPTLTFTAYAAQLYKNNTEKFTADEAWAILNPAPVDPEDPETT